MNVLELLEESYLPCSFNLIPLDHFSHLSCNSSPSHLSFNVMVFLESLAIVNVFQCILIKLWSDATYLSYVCTVYHISVIKQSSIHHFSVTKAKLGIVLSWRCFYSRCMGKKLLAIRKIYHFPLPQFYRF